MVTHVNSYRHQLLCVGANYLLHHRGQVIIFSLANDIEQL
jgi:hypothetical protein